MLERIEHENRLVTYQSPKLRDLGVVHGFSTRIGGASQDDYASLNLGRLTKGPTTDTNTAVAENYRRLRAALGLQRVPRFELRQVHGNAIWETTEKPPHPNNTPCADALHTDRSGQMLTVRTADCVPVLLADKSGRRVGAIHAGWRGIVAGVISTGVKAVGCDVIAAIGPCISVDYFEVGPEVAEAFEAADLAHGVTRREGSQYVNLLQCATEQLLEAGVAETNIDATDRCTYRDEKEFFSYRRDVSHRGGKTGHMAAVITRPV